MDTSTLNHNSSDRLQKLYRFHLSIISPRKRQSKKESSVAKLKRNRCILSCYLSMYVHLQCFHLQLDNKLQ